MFYVKYKVPPMTKKRIYPKSQLQSILILQYSRMIQFRGKFYIIHKNILIHFYSLLFVHNNIYPYLYQYLNQM